VTYYERIGVGYAERRRPDPRIERQIHRALADARSVVNVGAGAGSYEPSDRRVVAVDLVRGMLDQRPAGAAPAVQAQAERLPFPDDTFDVAMAILTVHHWADVEQGIAELRRVAARQVILHFEVTWQRKLWLTSDYLPVSAVLEEERAVHMDRLLALLEAPVVEAVPVPADCTDGFCGAYWRRPEAYLDAGVRQSISSISQLAPDQVEPGVTRLADDLASGRWHERYGDLLELDELDLGYRLVIAGGP
jgi:SAM-dependent methyltransferase